MGSETQSDSVDTASTSVVEESLNLSFKDVSYSVRHGLFAGGRKHILREVSGSFNAGELTVIMGQSGAGKSSLMDIMAGYTKPTSGQIFVNGRERNVHKFRRMSCYILQDDQVQSLLTIQESLAIAAELKLGSHVSRGQKKQRVEEIIKSLGLSEARRTKARDLSGGQRKRLAIGLELVSDPPVIFLDEPTSGLDSSISKQLIYLLHLLARQGRTVVFTMHQPSAGILELVDRLYAVVNGRCAYAGSVPNLLPFLQQINLICPPYHNPVDFLIEICVENANDLVKFSQNGSTSLWTAPVSHEKDEKLREKYNNTNCEKCLTNLPLPKEDPTAKILLALKSTYPTSQWKQFSTLTRRSLLSIWRDPSFTYTMTGIHCAMALFVGCLFWNINADAQNVQNNYHFLYFSLMFLMFTAFSSVTVYFPEQIPIVRREHFNRWYSTGAFYLSALMSSLPTQTLCTLTFTCITYWMTGQLADVYRFFLYTVVLLLVSYSALCLGLLNGSMFNTKNGVVFGPLMIMPFTVFSGFFLQLKDSPVFFRWMFHVSFLKHGLVGLAMTVFGFGRTKIHICNSPLWSCRYSNTRVFLKDQGMDEEQFHLAIVALIGIIITVAIVAYVVLKVRLKLKKW